MSLVLRASLAVAVCALAVTSAPLRAQEFRGTLLTTARFLELRPIAQDTVPVDQVTELPDGTFEFEGFRVFCIGLEGCVFYRPVDPVQGVVLTQDLSLTAWGFGVSGLSATVLVRGRGDLGGDFTWPRSDNAFDAILAYAELNRDLFRLRVGRQRTITGLGFPGYDGAHLRVDPLGWLRLEAYGGRSLARGLEEPRHEALRGIEAFLPDRNAWLIGAAGEVEPEGWQSVVALRYQREIWAHRTGLVSERASLDGRTLRLRPVDVDFALDYDFAFGHIGKAHVSARYGLPAANLVLEATGRRYVPYFELWTIWGFFSPVAYHEALAQARWTPLPRLSLQGFVSRRVHDETNAPTIISPIDRTTTRFGATALYAFPVGLLAEASYSQERGFGAFVSSGDASVSWSPIPALALGLHGSAAQQIEQFRLGEGVLLGLGGSAEFAFVGGSRVAVGIDRYSHTFENRPSMGDWSQTRAWATARLAFGEDPGPRLPGRRP